MHKIELISELDRTTLAMYCQALADYLVAKKIVDERGLTYETPNGRIYSNPAVPIMQEAWARAMKGAARFGLSPSDRVHLRSDAGAQKTDPRENLLLSKPA